MLQQCKGLAFFDWAKRLAINANNPILDFGELKSVALINYHHTGIKTVRRP